MPHIPREILKDITYAAASLGLAFAFVSLTWKLDMPNLFRIRAGRPPAEQSQEPIPSLKFTGARGKNLRPFFYAGKTFDVFYFDHVNQAVSEFAGATLLATSFTYATLPFANFKAADIRGSYFDHASLRGADFRGARLDYSNFIQSDLSNADFRGTDLSSARLLLSKLDGARFDRETKLPFPIAEAIARGMKRVE